MSVLFCGCIFFGDDILLLNGCLSHQHILPHICTKFPQSNDMKFNLTKSHLYTVGVFAKIHLQCLHLSIQELKRVSELKSLDVDIMSGEKLSVSVDVTCS